MVAPADLAVAEVHLVQTYTMQMMKQVVVWRQ
jgi:hypothetical protein